MALQSISVISLGWMLRAAMGHRRYTHVGKEALAKAAAALTEL